MNKTELVKAIANSAGTTNELAKNMLDAFINNIQKALKSGGEVIIPGFGKFSVSKRAARTGRNPRTGAEIRIPAARLPKFKAGKSLKEAVER